MSGEGTDEFNEGVEAAAEAAAGAAIDDGETDPETPVKDLPDDVPDGDVGTDEPETPAEGEKP